MALGPNNGSFPPLYLQVTLVVATSGLPQRCVLCSRVVAGEGRTLLKTRWRVPRRRPRAKRPASARSVVTARRVRESAPTAASPRVEPLAVPEADGTGVSLSRAVRTRRHEVATMEQILQGPTHEPGVVEDRLGKARPLDEDAVPLEPEVGDGRIEPIIVQLRVPLAPP